MAKLLRSQSTLTDRYQTTIPDTIREVLSLNKKDKIEYVVDQHGKVTILKAREDDPIISKFLTFIANDIKKYPEHIKLVNQSLFLRAKSLVSDVDIDLDAPLSEKDE